VTRRCVWNEGWWRHARRSPSPNEGPRPEGAVTDLVVLHSISLPPGQFGGPEVEAFFRNRLDSAAHPYFEQIKQMKVSAHFFVRRSGEVVQFVSCDRRAWHAGASSWRGREQCNDYSIGIELEGLDDGSRFCKAQYAALASVLRALARRYPVTDIAGHEHVAPGRKADPGPGFDWHRLQRVLGARWHGPEVSVQHTKACAAHPGTSRYEHYP
jgi:N-acetyl-anhydromuramoyl-L-alanine amidase